MWYLVLADVIVLVHFLFVLFVMFGSLIVLRWPRVLWIHLSAVIWGLVVELAGTPCPLTPLENRLRLLGGEAGYSEDFLSHWLLTILYPESLTRGLQVTLGASLLLLNMGLYLWIWKRKSGQSGNLSRSNIMGSC